MNSLKHIGIYIYLYIYPRETVKNLSRHRDWIERNIVAINNRLSTSSTEYNRKIVAQGSRADITEIEKRMTRALVEYCQHQRSGTGNGSTSACNCLHREWFNWVQAAKQHNTENGADIASIKQRELVERTPFPSFNGSQKGWAEFRRVFEDMISLSCHGKTLELAQLAASYPRKQGFGFKE